MHLGPFQRKKADNSKEKTLKNLDRQERLGNDELGEAEHELLYLDSEMKRISHPLYLNQLEEEIEDHKNLISQNEKIIKAARSGNKKDMADLDRLLAGRKTPHIVLNL